MVIPTSEQFEKALDECVKMEVPGALVNLAKSTVIRDLVRMRETTAIAYGTLEGVCIAEMCYVLTLFHAFMYAQKQPDPFFAKLEEEIREPRT